MIADKSNSSIVPPEDKSFRFYLNGQPVFIENPQPDLLLVDWLRSPEVGLTGTKKCCGQGGCGACTVILSAWNAEQGHPVHRAVHACLQYMCSLGGLSVTTIEGTDSEHTSFAPHHLHANLFSCRIAPPMFQSPAQTASLCALTNETCPAVEESKRCGNPVALRMAVNNGTQCGYCTPGIVMNMFAFLMANPKPTQRAIEDRMDGNICRCTGYRSILTGLKTFACDWSASDEEQRMKCETEEDFGRAIDENHLCVNFPDAAKAGARPIRAGNKKQQWMTPTSLQELRDIARYNPGRNIRLVQGGTTLGLEPSAHYSAEILVDLRMLSDLSGCIISEYEMEVGSAIRYSDLIHHLESSAPGVSSAWAALAYMCRRTGSSILRESATLGGNTMLALGRIHAGTPVVSDALSALSALDGMVHLMNLRSGQTEWIPVNQLIEEVRLDHTRLEGILLLRYRIPRGDSDVRYRAYKVGARHTNAQSWNNAVSVIRINTLGRVDLARFVFGGIAPFPWRASNLESAISGAILTKNNALALRTLLENEILSAAAVWRDRWAAGDPTVDERANLCGAFFFKSLVDAMRAHDENTVEPEWRSASDDRRSEWPVSRGEQAYTIEPFKAPLGRPFVKLSAFQQANGRIRYSQDLDISPKMLHAAFVLSRAALASFRWVIPGQSCTVSAQNVAAHLASNHPEFVRLLVAQDIPKGGMNYMGMGGDQPLLAESHVHYHGQAVALVIARTMRAAENLAEIIAREHLVFDLSGNSSDHGRPILSLEDAIKSSCVFPDNPKTMNWLAHVWRITRPQSRLEWIDPERDPLDRTIRIREIQLDGCPCLAVETAQSTGSQMHFYMETQTCLVTPTGDNRFIVYASAQDPAAIHAAVASILGVNHIAIETIIPPVGGGFGGKMEPSRFVAAPVALAAHLLQLPVRMAMAREADCRMTGRRHPCHGSVALAVDNGKANPLDCGRLRGLHARMWLDGGAFYDCSFVVSDCIQLRSDNAYQIDNYRTEIDVCRTHTAPNTAFRAFGFVQSNLILENAIEEAAVAIGMPPHELREKNLYDRGDVTPAGQALSYCYLREVWLFLRNEVARYDERLVEVEQFNRRHRWCKRGLCMLPLKYGAGYNLTLLEQSTVLVGIYSSDGSVVIHQGGVEMGQGLITMIRQVASYVLNIPMDIIRVETPRTAVIPNPIATGASTGTTYNGLAVRQACEQLRSRLVAFAYEMRDEYGNDWCRDRGIDFWNHGTDGWSFTTSKPYGSNRLIWQNLIQLAESHRVNLMVQWKSRIEGGTTPVPILEYKPASLQPALAGVPRDNPDLDPSGSLDEFVDFTYSAACSEVEVDLLTGEVKIVRSDVVYDVGWSLNPALDIGQVEGAFVQGIGYLIHENVVHNPDGSLHSDNTWTYKLPAASCIPLDFRVHLFPRSRVAHIPENRRHLFSAKEVGEPPLVLANTVFLAVKAAIRAARIERGITPHVQLDTPASPTKVLQALTP